VEIGRNFVFHCCSNEMAHTWFSSVNIVKYHFDTLRLGFQSRASCLGHLVDIIPVFDSEVAFAFRQ